MKKIVLILIYVWPLFLLTAPAAMALLVNIPGQPNAGVSPKDYVQSLYNFGRIAVGATAFGVIVYAALEYTASAGNTSRQQDARDRIKEAIMGIVLLFGATILFDLINPQIFSFTNPTFNTSATEPAAPGGTAEPAAPGGGTAGPGAGPQNNLGGATPINKQ